jgi:DNA-binding FadR family transcriptional regulator
VKASIAIAAALRARIAQGELVPGDPLPVEDELIEALGCSRPVVREALRILETEGLVEVRRGLGGGARVRQPSISDAAKTMGVYLRIGDVPVLDVWTARDRIIAASLERLATEAATADLDQLDAHVAALADSVGDLTAFDAHLLDLGELTVRLAGNATEAVLVAALRHIIDAAITRAASRITDAEGYEYACREQQKLAAAWRRALQQLRAGRGRAGRQAYEHAADALRALVGRDATWPGAETSAAS